MALSLARSAFAGLSRVAATGSTPAAGAAVNAVAWRRSMSAQVDPATLDARAIEVYKQHPGAYMNIPLDEIQFKVGEHYVTKANHPSIHRGSSELLGVLHVTPFAITTYNDFGPTGNLGRSIKLANGTDLSITDPKDAQQEFALSGYPLACQTGANDLMLGYFQWLTAIEEKFIDHLMENTDAYSGLNSWVEEQRMVHSSDESVRQVLALAGQTSPFIRILKTPKSREDDGPDDDNRYLAFKQRVYMRHSDPTLRADAGPHDADAAAAGFQRRHVPLFNMNNEEISIADCAGHRGDVVAVQMNITCRMFQVGSNFGVCLNKNLRSVTRLRQAPGPASSNPFAGFDFNA